jgi:hypothetical protein
VNVVNPALGVIGVVFLEKAHLVANPFSCRRFAAKGVFPDHTLAGQEVFVPLMREGVEGVHPLAQGQRIKGARVKRWAAGNCGLGKRRGGKAGQTGGKGRASHAAFHFAR